MRRLSPISILLLAAAVLLLGVPVAQAQRRHAAHKSPCPSAVAAKRHRHGKVRAACASARRKGANGRLASSKWLGSSLDGNRQIVAASSKPSKKSSPPPAPATGSGLHVGITIDSQGWGGGVGDRQRQGLATGAKWSREEFSWSVVEPQAGVWDWSRYDSLMTAAAQNGLNILANPFSTPAWAGASWNQIPVDPSAYADFIARIAARYGPGGSFWQSHPSLPARPLQYIELWNEPYCSCFSYGGVNPARYAALVKASVLAGRAANANVKYLIEADTAPGDFLAGMYAAMPDLNRYFDAVAVHPYSDDRSPLLTNDTYGFQRIGYTRNVLVANGASDKPMWITEMGWPTCPGGAAYECVSEAQQAEYLQAAFDLVKTQYSSFVRALFVYHYNDFAPGNPNDREQWFGLTRTDGSHKPAYAVFQAQAAGTT
jgi:Beta-galactosidase